jgi:very-short-patch-repair endonuclease
VARYSATGYVDIKSPLKRGVVRYSESGCVMHIKYKQDLRELSKDLRNNSTLSEVILWSYLKGRKMLGYKFNRQRVIGKYIVDFFCYELMLAIEIDGSSHGEMENLKYDEKRQEELEKKGIRFLRFGDSYIKKDISGVLGAISSWIRDDVLASADTPRPRVLGHPSY